MLSIEHLLELISDHEIGEALSYYIFLFMRDRINIVNIALYDRL
jgi:hypothetical protein